MTHICVEIASWNAWGICCASQLTAAQILPLAQCVNNV